MSTATDNLPEFFVHPEPQGSPGWLAGRALRFNAGDAAAMLSCSPHGSRTDLLDELVKGYSPDVTTFKQAIYDSGHRYEALARPLAVNIIGEDLYPLVCSRRVPDLKRRLGASCDGLTMLRDVGNEHKRLNDVLRQAMPHSGPHSAEANQPSALPKCYRAQMEQQLLVVKTMQRVLFSATDWDENGNLLDERHCWYESDPELRAELLAGWRQFEADMEGHVPVVRQERARGIKAEALGELTVRVAGSVVQSNLPEWRAMAIARIEAINKTLKTDEDFGQAKVDVTWLEESARAVKDLKARVIAQMADVSEVITTLDGIVKLQDRTRLDLAELVKRRETEVRGEVCTERSKALADYLLAQTRRVGVGFAITMADVEADFAGAIKGKRTVKSLHDAADAHLARCKIAASALADRMQANCEHVRDAAADVLHLFPDLGPLCRKLPEDFHAIVEQRLAKHRAAIAAAAEELRQAAEQRRQDELARQQAAALARPDTLTETGNNAAPATGAQTFAESVMSQPVHGARQGHTAHPIPARAMVERVHLDPEGDPFTLQVPARARGGPPTLKLGTICERLGFNVTAAFLTELGYEGQRGERNAVLYHQEDFRAICAAIVSHVTAAGHKDWSQVPA